MTIHEARRLHFDTRRRQLLGGLDAVVFRAAAPADGAFYLYMDVSSSGLDSYDFCWRLINEFQVAATPGIDFGEREAHRFVRFAYTTDDESIGLGLERIGRALEAWDSVGGQA
ncbi:MAG: aminotransferase class I/II-fold pyridoxal phosphate-dependent enzyme [Gammaproteobacteria bacterium]|nr:aminotransferase class I/II-fold pyridoxal phosphate-dependent enzyme [Gammaproteobacteria bacterium]